jgi:hypothetical protein
VTSPSVLLLGVTNVALAIWVAVTAISCLLQSPNGRDLRPLVLPIFTSLALAALQAEWLWSDRTASVGALTDLGWSLVRMGQMLSILLLVNAYGKRRA